MWDAGHVLADPGREVALYYPDMVPPDRWLRHALLIYDGVSSIVHPDFLPGLLDDVYFTREAVREQRELFGRRLSTELTWLIDEGAWRPQEVKWIRDSIDYESEVHAALNTFASDPQYKFGGDLPPSGELTRLYLGKLSYFVEEGLQELELAGRRRFDERYMVVHQEVAAVVLAITAKHMAAGVRDPDVRTVLGTDQTERYRQAFGDLGQPGTSHLSRELILSGLAPVPGDAATFQEIIHFRRQHADELMAFRVEIDRLVERVSQSESPMDEVRAARREIVIASEQLSKAAQSRRFTLASGSLTLATVGLAATALPPENVEWGFSGFGAAAAVMLIERMVRRPQPSASNPYSYLLRARGEYGD